MPKLKPETIMIRRDHILRAALVCFAAKGYHQTTMDDIVAEAGLSKGGLYVHFKSKKELFLNLFDWFLDEFGLLASPPPTESPAFEKLTLLVKSMLTTLSSDSFREVSVLMTDIWAQNIRDQDLNQLAKELYRQLGQPISQIIEDGIESGLFKQVNPMATANILIAIFEGLTIQDIIDRAAIDWSAIAVTLDTLLTGLLAEGDA